jgi:uncharacterized protein YciI
MKFAAVIEYLQDKDKVGALRPQHRQYLASLREQGQLVASGPFTDDSGALIIFEATDREQAEGFLKGDPFYRNGIFLHYQLRPWNPVIANLDLLAELR